MTQQLSAALGDHLGVKETLLTPKKERNYTHVARASQFHTYSAPMTRGIREKKHPMPFYIITKKERHNSHYGKGFLAWCGYERWGRTGTWKLLGARGRKQKSHRALT